MAKWTQEELNFLIENYSQKGKMYCCQKLNRTESSIRWMASELKLKQNRNSNFFKDWQERAKNSKIGKKRPDQSLLMKSLHEQGKLLKTEKQIEAMKLRMKDQWKRLPHPKGMLGKKHTEETLKVISIKSKEKWKDPDFILNSKEYRDKMSIRSSIMMAERVRMKPTTVYSKAKRGFRDDIGFYVRSSWEANYARYLNYLIEKKEIIRYEYEPETFWFETIKRGVRSYLPDFKVYKNDGSIEYHEVKGWMDDKSKTKLKRMAKYHPQIKIVLIDQKAYNEIKKINKEIIENWED